ncbi:hypothetical protein [Pelagicoccus mobilis]|uniref:Uncharacterized protein n=1 Tax=Pelagicoccus mobilis TaxID=415221 RepID=A0A934VQP3_9BACT|nr:hypothetical protein [Pelagicoccus mobilis]MBK1878557.1 hypothetical protein [Pelagicoccus mobilis]
MKISRSSSSVRLAFFLIAALSLVSVSQACSVCVVGKEEARTAYYATTAILSFLPLIMIGGVVYYIFKKNRKIQKD